MRALRIFVVLALMLAACGGSEGGDTTTSSSVPSTTTSTVASTTSSTTPSTTTTTSMPSTTTTTVPRTTTTLPTLTQEEAAASLEDVTATLFQAWLNENVDAYPAISRDLASTVSGLVSTHKSFPDTDGWRGELLRLSDGIEQPFVGARSDEYFVEGTFTRLAVIGVPGAPVTLFTGVYRVGDVWTGSSGSHSGNETTIPGTYVVLDVEGCYWERLDNTGRINDNNFISAAPRVEATISSSDYAFNSEGCGRWVRVSD